MVDLFCGVGGLSLGAARAGFTIRGAVDHERAALGMHGTNFPNTKHVCKDIAGLTGESIRRWFGVDAATGMIGSPPCQGFSTMGKGNPEDVRNDLFVDFFRIVAETKPKFFLAENVPGMMREKYSAVRQHALSLVKPHYDVMQPMKLAAHHYGAPTTRRRVFFVGCLKGSTGMLTEDDFKPSPDMEPVLVRDALHGLPTDIDQYCRAGEKGWRTVNSWHDTPFAKRLRGHVPPGAGDHSSMARLLSSNEVSGFLGTVHNAEVVARYSNTEQGKHDAVSKSQRLDLDGFCPTLRAGTGPDKGSFQAVRPIHPTEERVITPREAARLQGFPDWFQFSPTKWNSFRQIGNSVSPLLAEHVFGVIASAIRNPTSSAAGSA